jgi:hypothetical protein
MGIHYKSLFVPRLIKLKLENLSREDRVMMATAPHNISKEVETHEAVEKFERIKLANAPNIISIE